MISIIVPVYNVKPYLRQCLDSILRQTYRDFELILVDDCSTDGSLSICEEYAAKDNRIHLLMQKQNGGVAKARNTGLSHVQGDYITFVDSDDYLPDNALEILFRLAQETGADIAYGGFYTDCDNKISKKKFRFTKKYYSHAEALKAYLNFRTLYGMGWGKLYHQTVLDGVEDPLDMSVADDTIITYHALTKAKNGVAFTTKPVYYYRIRTDSLSGYGQSFRKRDLDFIKGLEYMSKYTDAKYRSNLVTFSFITYLGVIKKYLASDEKSRLEFCKIYDTVKTYCEKNWKAVALHSSNPRIQLKALSYGLNFLKRKGV